MICKLLNGEYPSVLELSTFRREYQITAKLQGDGAVKALALEEADNSLAMILEDSGGVSLDRDARLALLFTSSSPEDRHSRVKTTWSLFTPISQGCRRRW